jgi:hypothetical protein
MKIITESVLFLYPFYLVIMYFGGSDIRFYVVNICLILLFILDEVRRK